MQTQERSKLPDRAFRNSFKTDEEMQKFMSENNVDIMGNTIEQGN